MVPMAPPHQVGKAPALMVLPVRVERDQARAEAKEEEKEKARVLGGTAAPVTTKVTLPARTGSRAAGPAEEAVGAIGRCERAKASGFADLLRRLVSPSGPIASLIASLPPELLALPKGGHVHGRTRRHGTTYGLFLVPLPVPPPPQLPQ